MKLLVDVSNLCWTYLQSGTDKEGGRKIEVDGKKVQVNSAQHGFDGAVDFIAYTLNDLNMVPRNIIFVEEQGESTGFRRQIYAGYKVKTGASKKPPECYAEFDKMCGMLRTAFLPLGSQFVTQANVEGDDIIAYLAQTLKGGSIILSTDKDMQACISDTASVYYKGQYNENRLGPFPVRYTTLYKALVGDDGDKIGGASGFGEVAFLNLLVKFGEDGLDMMQDLIVRQELEKLHEDVPAMKALQKVIDGREDVYRSWQLARLYPERVNTMRRPLQWTVAAQKAVKGAEYEPALAQWQPRQKIVHAGNFQKTIEWFKDEIAASPFVAFDIETTQPQESLDWFAQRGKGEDGVDVLSQSLVGFSMTLGANGQYTLYAAVDHNEMDGYANISISQVAEMLQAIPATTEIVVQNASFELTVMYREVGEYLLDNGWHGFLPNIRDTKLMANHVDENSPVGLKALSKRYLGYDQVSYKDVTQGRRMNEMTLTETFDYGADDALCTSALYSFFRTVMEIEDTWQAYLAVEVKPAYLTALAFTQGVPISMQTLLKQESEDQASRAAAWSIVRAWLIERGWNGTVPPCYPIAITAAQIKEAYNTVTGVDLETKVRTPSKILTLIETDGDYPSEMGERVTALASHLKRLLNAGDAGPFNDYVNLFFKGEPELNFGSPKQLQELLYSERGLNLPIRTFNKPTDNMRAAGLKQGSPATDALAVEYALQLDGPTRPDILPILKALQAIKIAETRQGLYYSPYRNMPHWKTGLIHASMNQSATNTRRYTGSDPNIQQLPKHAKATGEPAKFREVFVPHRPGAVVVSIDYSGQELRLIADDSQDPNMVACYVGDNLQDMHALTGAGILHRRIKAGKFERVLTDAGKNIADFPEPLATETKALLSSWSSGELKAISADESSPWNQLGKVTRALGKKVNFTTEYGAMAPKLAKTLLVETDEAQLYIDAKLEAFPIVAQWKEQLVSRSKDTGAVRSHMGALRHLGAAYLSHDGYSASKAERQAVNFRIQGAAAEMTKMAMGRIWDSGVVFDYDCRFYFPVHDELVFSVMADDLVDFLNIVHPLMVQQFANMQVPVIGSISFGPTYGEQYEVGDDVDEAKIAAALTKCFPPSYAIAA